MKKIYNWVISQSQKPNAIWWLGSFSFAESSFFPIPPDVLLVPMCIARQDRAWFYGFWCMVASVTGGFLGYWIGHTLFESIGVSLLNLYGYRDAFDRTISEFQSWAFWAISLKGLTPIPYKIVTIASGVANIDLKIFFLASIVARSVRFFTLSGLCWHYGDSIKSFIDNHLNKVALGILLLIIVGFVLLKFL